MTNLVHGNGSNVLRLRRLGIDTYQEPVVVAAHVGFLPAIDNRRLARLAKLAGAPFSKAAGLEMQVRLGDKVEVSAPLCTLHAESRGELEYAASFARQNDDIFQWRGADQ